MVLWHDFGGICSSPEILAKSFVLLRKRLLYFDQAMERRADTVVTCVRRKKESYLMVLPVRRRIHWGMGLFCFWALASLTLVRKDLWLCVATAS